MSGPPTWLARPTRSRTACSRSGVVGERRAGVGGRARARVGGCVEVLDGLPGAADRVLEDVEEFAGGEGVGLQLLQRLDGGAAGGGAGVIVSGLLYFAASGAKSPLAKVG
ncbi:hypothetical protein [Actinacidiphila soli]|uniref:hypothetical protein n=1 Tax=Actinacidiphila soli TaxID=2487275 RepID=UPI0013E2C05C|nr:hypothetical protein [Actinacidiphila soli]